MIKKIFSVCLVVAILVFSSISASAAVDGVTGKCLKVYSYTVGEQMIRIDMDATHALKPETEYNVSFCYTLGSAHTSTKWGFGVSNIEEDKLAAYTEWNPIDLKYIWDLTIQDDDAEPIFTDIVWLDDEVVKCTFNFTTPSYVTSFGATNQVGVGDALFDNVHVESVDGSHSYDIDFEKGSTLADNFVSAKAEHELTTRNVSSGSNTSGNQNNTQTGNNVVIGGNTSSEDTSSTTDTQSETEDTESDSNEIESDAEDTDSEIEVITDNKVTTAAEADFAAVEKTLDNFTVLMIVLVSVVGVAVVGAAIVMVLVIKKLR